MFVIPGLRRKPFQDGDDTILELRGTGHGTVFPPSRHESGEPIAWDAFGEPTRLDVEDPLRPFRLLATKALIARRLPHGGGHDFARAPAGFLLRGERLDEDNALKVMEDARDCAGYPGGKDRSDAMRDLQRIVEDTAKKLENGKLVQGGPTLESMSPGLPGKIAEWWDWDTSDEKVLGLVEQVEESGDPDFVWEGLGVLAKVSAVTYQKAKKRLKDRLGFYKTRAKGRSYWHGLRITPVALIDDSGIREKAG